MSIAVVFPISFALFFFSLANPPRTFGQAEDAGDEPAIELDDSVMKDVVLAVFRTAFKPDDRNRVLEIYEKGIQRSWLPAWKNTQFLLLTKDEIIKQKKKVYFLTPVKLDGNREFNIGLGFGNPFCDYTGESWNFKVPNVRRTFRPSGGFGGGCFGGDVTGH